MSKSSSPFKAILFFDRKEMKRNKARIGSVFTGTNQMSLIHDYGCYDALVNGLNACCDDIRWQDTEANIVEFPDSALAIEQITQARLSALGLLRVYRYDRKIITGELALLVEIMRAASRVILYSEEVLAIIKKKRKLTTVVGKNAVDDIKTAYTNIGQQCDDTWEHLVNPVEQTLKRLEIE